MSIFQYVLENGLKANIWVNNFPAIIKEVKDELLVEGDTKTYTNSKQLVVELFIPRSHNNYALLGIDFISDRKNKVKIKMSIENQQKRKNDHSLALSFDTVMWGILEEYRQGVMDSLHLFIALCYTLLKKTYNLDLGINKTNGTGIFLTASFSTH